MIKKLNLYDKGTKITNIVDMESYFKPNFITINFIDPGTGGSGVATIVDSNTNRVDNSNIGRRVIYTRKIDKNKTPMLEFDIYSKIGENYELPLDINGMVVSFKKIDGMTQLPLFENDNIDPNKIRKFKLDLSKSPSEINIECNIERFDYYFNDISNFKRTKNAIITENNNDLINKTFGFGDGVIDLSDAFEREEITSTPKMIVARNVNDFSHCFYYCTKITTIPQSLFDNCTNVNDFSYCFDYCTSLTTIPQGLFDNCTNVTNFSHCFYYCSSLTTIPQGLFDNCTNVNDFSYCFENCKSLTSISSGLFDKCSKVTNFTYCFYYCTKITTIPQSLFDNCTNVTNFSHCFDYCTSLTTIPQGLFDNCTNVNDFSYCFYYCTSLTTIPQSLFDNCTNVNDFSYCFDYCFSLTTIPQGLFDNCTNVNDFSYCFHYCTKITTIPQSLFDNCTNVNDFSYCFYYCSSLTSALPDVWNKSKFPNVTNGEDYAYRCTKAANYNEIPADFK